MATLAARLEVSVNGGGLDASLSAQGELIAAAVALVEALKSGDVPGLAAFVARLAALDLPDAGLGGDAAAALGRARAALGVDLGAASGGTLAEIARFADEAGKTLLPVLDKVTAAARAIEVLARIDLRCRPATSAAGGGASGGGAAGGGGAGAPVAEDDAAATGAARAEGVVRRLDEVDGLLDLIPEPFDMAAFARQLVALTLQGRRNDFLGMTLPILDDALMPLQTLARWEAMTDAELSASLQGTMQALRERLLAAGPERLGVAVAGAAALAAPLNAPAYAVAHQAVLDAGAALATAIAGGDTATITAATATLDAALDALAARETAMAVGFTAAAGGAARRLAAAPGDVADHLVHLAVQLEPVDPAALLRALPQPVAPDPALKAEIEAALAPVTEFMEDLAGLLDIAAVRDRIAEAADEAQRMADAVQAALADVVGAARAAFAEVEAALEGLNLDGLAAQMRTAIATTGNRIEDAIAAAFAPLREALETALSELSAAVAALDFDAVAAALEQVLAAVAGVLNDPGVRGAVDEVRAALDDIARTLRGLSFAPVTDEVIALIERMTEGLRAVASGDLNPAVKGLLGTAMGVLPPDLRPATDPLVVQFGRSIEAGPVELVERIRAEPARILDSIRAFEPATVIGDRLSQPMRALTAGLDSVSVKALFAPVRREMDAAKGRLKAQAAPSKMLAPVVVAFDSLRADLDALSPDAVLDPIEQALQKAIDSLLTAVPLEAALAEVAGVFDTLDAALGMLGRVGGTLERLEAAFDGMAEGDASLDGWRDAVLARMDALPDAAGLTAAMTALRDAAAGTAQGPLLARFDADAATLVAALAALAPRERQAQAAVLRQSLGTVARALPAGPVADAVGTVLARFDPLDPAATAGLRAAVALDVAVTGARARLQELAPVWAGALHGEGATLRQLAEGAADPATLRVLVAPEVERALGPVRQVAARLAQAAPVAGALAGTARSLQAGITDSLGDPLTGPDGLAAIVEAMEQVVATLRGLDLSALRVGIQGVFDTVKARLDALGPRPMLVSLDREFAAVIDTLNLDRLFPEDALQALEAQLDAIRGGLAGLDPGRLVVGAVQPVWERDVLPVVAALDLTPVFDALIETLRDLDDELRGEIGRVNGAYQTLLAARPPGIGGVSVTVSIG